MKNFTTAKQKLELELMLVRATADFLKFSEAKKLEMMRSVGTNNNISTKALSPCIQAATTTRKLRSATYLLKLNNCQMACREFNGLMIEHGYIAISDRLSSKGLTKSYNVLTAKGLKYGVNYAYKKTAVQTQVRYRNDTFLSLFELVLRNVGAPVHYNNSFDSSY